MALKKVFQDAKDKLNPEKKKHDGKVKHFMHELGAWFISPGGLATLVLLGLTLAYIHHNYKQKSA